MLLSLTQRAANIATTDNNNETKVSIQGALYLALFAYSSQCSHSTCEVGVVYYLNFTDEERKALEVNGLIQVHSKC